MRSIEADWGNYFKAEVKASGFKLVAQEKVSLANHSDTRVEAYVRVSPPLKVVLASEGAASAVFTARCSCPAADKAQFCKHVWAVLLLVGRTCPEFLSGKGSLEKAELTEAEAESRAKSASYQENAKARAAEYRKAQYQKQKEKAKALKRGGKVREEAIVTRAFPADVEAALGYFEQNGFEMPTGPSAEVIAEAKKKLSRVFHPDRGGTHAEIVELNENTQVLLRFLEGGLG